MIEPPAGNLRENEPEENAFMHFSLVFIGAHNGAKLDGIVADAKAMGKVLLVEPVPYLFAQLERKFGGDTAVVLKNLCIAPAEGKARFFAPLPSANSVYGFGDQLGSLLENHASNHDLRFSEHVEQIEVRSETFESIIDDVGITSIDVLYSDTEGMDITLLGQFPFARLTPRKIVFEFKHADGTNRIGKKLAAFLIWLDDLGYRIKVLDSENLLAVYVGVANDGIGDAEPAGRHASAAGQPPARKIDRLLRFLLKG